MTHTVMSFFYVVCVCSLFVIRKKSYVGYTNDVQRRLFEHNVSESKGFTLRYRPWIVIQTECYESKQDAIRREKFLKTGQGRELLRLIIKEYLES